MTPAAAHQGPEILKLAFRPDSDGLVMVSNRGLIFSGPGAPTARLLCPDALSISNTEQPDVALVRDGRALIATSGGLRATADEGCSLQAVEPYGSTMSPALAQDPLDPDTVYLATFAAGAGGVQVSRDAGATWSTLLRTPDDEFIQDLRVGPTDSTVLYASGQRIVPGGPRTHFITHSLDAGATWTRFDITLEPSESDLVLLAVHPDDGLSVVAKTISRAPMQRLVLSSDGGQSWRSVLQTELLHDAAFSAAGSTLWAASDAGLWRSSDGGERFEPPRAPGWMSCISERGQALWVCGQFTDGLNGVAVSHDGGDSFEAVARLQEVASAVQCPAESRTEQVCEGSLEDWQRELRSLDAARPGADAGTGEARDAAAAEEPAADKPASDDGCSVASPSALDGSMALLLLAALRRRQRPVR